MQHSIQRFSKLALTSCFLTLALSGHAAAFTPTDMPIACLPQRMKVDQQEACHCPPEFKCDELTTPNFVKTICCDEPPVSSGICTENGCPTGWHYDIVDSVQGSGPVIPMQLFYCDVEPDCSAIFDHIPREHNGQPIEIYERDYTVPTRVPVKTTFDVYLSDVSVEGWVCDASPILSQAPTAGPMFWLYSQIKEALGVYSFADVCVIPAFPNESCLSPIGVSPDSIGICSFAEDCLPSDTKVTLEDGNMKRIQEVKVGDKLQAQTSINTVLEVLMNKSEKRQIYSINGGELTITEGHPLLTQHGWATAGHVQSARNADKKNWSGRELKAGDVIIGRNQTIRVRSVSPLEVKDMDTYNLRLSGDNTFLANGAIVQGFDSLEVNYSTEKKDAAK